MLHQTGSIGTHNEKFKELPQYSSSTSSAVLEVVYK